MRYLNSTYFYLFINCTSCTKSYHCHWTINNKSCLSY